MMSMSHNQRVLVTGGAGYLGRHLVVKLLSLDFKVTVLDLKLDFISHELGEKIEVVKGDIRDFDFVQEELKRIKPAKIFHLAAQKSVQESFSNPESYFETNTNSTLNLAKLALDQGVEKLLFVSSAAVYGEQTLKQYESTSDLLPTSPYGNSKLMAEKGLKHIFGGCPEKLVIVRLFNLFGYETELFSDIELLSGENLQSFLARALKDKSPFKVYKSSSPTIDNSNMRDFIHPRVAADTLIRLSLIQGMSGINVNLGSGKAHSVLQVVHAVEKIIEENINLEWWQAREGDIPLITADLSELKKLLQKNSFESNLEELVDFYKYL